MAKTLQSLKVCYLSVATHLGGGERSLLDLIAQLQKGKQVKPWVIFPKQEGPFLEECKKRGISYSVCEMPELFSRITRDKPFYSFLCLLVSIPSFLIYLNRLVQLIEKEKPDLLHTNGIKSHLIGALLTVRKRIPLIWHGRDIFQGFTLSLLRIFSQWAKPFILFNSKAAADAFGDYPSAKVVYNGIDLPASSGFLAHSDLNFHEALQKKFVFGILGVLARWKGQDLFLDLARALKAEGCGFVIMGSRIYDTASDLGYEQELKDRANGLPVLFTGKVDPPFDYLRKIDCLVHCSRKPEPFGRVIVEAQLVGIPVIAAAAGGVLEIIEDGKNGFLYPPNDLAALVEKAQKVMKDTEARTAVSKEGRNSAMARFSVSSHSQQVLDLYGQVLKNSIR